MENLVHWARLGLRLTDEEREEFNQRLKALFDEYVARPPSPDAKPWGIFFAAHPDPGRTETPVPRPAHP